MAQKVAFFAPDAVRIHRVSQPPPRRNGWRLWLPLPLLLRERVCPAASSSSSCSALLLLRLLLLGPAAGAWRAGS